MPDCQLEQNIEALRNSKKTLVEKHEFLQEILVQSMEIPATELKSQLCGLEAQARNLAENKAELLKYTHDLSRKRNELRVARDVLECERDTMKREISKFEQGVNENEVARRIVEL